MQTEHDIMIDGIYEDVGNQLNEGFDAIVEGVMESNEISPEIMVKILEIWFIQSTNCNDHAELSYLKKGIINAS